MLAAFLGQFYDNKPPPPLILLSDDAAECELLAEALSLRAGRKVEIAVPQRGDKRKLIEHALLNAREALGRRMAESAHADAAAATASPTRSAWRRRRSASRSTTTATSPGTQRRTAR